MNKIAFVSITLILLFSCNMENTQKKEGEPDRVKTMGSTSVEEEKPIVFSPDEIKGFVNLQERILNGLEPLFKSMDKFGFGNYYYVFGVSGNQGMVPEKRRAAELDAKRWGAIFMKFLLRGETDLNVSGEQVNFLESLGEFYDNKEGKMYVIYRFKKR